MKNALKPKFPGFLAIAVLAIGMALSLACEEDSEAPVGETPTPGGETPIDGIDGAEPVTFDISLGDNFFEPNEFTVQPGQRVTFNITNDGAAIHNMHIAGPDGEYDTDDDALSEPHDVGPGETATLEWTAPEEPGDIVFRCDFHALEQTGTITVQ